MNKKVVIVLTVIIVVILIITGVFFFMKDFTKDELSNGNTNNKTEEKINIPDEAKKTSIDVYVNEKNSPKIYIDNGTVTYKNLENETIKDTTLKEKAKYISGIFGNGDTVVIVAVVTEDGNLYISEAISNDVKEFKFEKQNITFKAAGIEEKDNKCVVGIKSDFVVYEENGNNHVLNQEEGIKYTVGKSYDEVYPYDVCIGYTSYSSPLFIYHDGRVSFSNEGKNYLSEEDNKELKVKHVLHIDDSIENKNSFILITNDNKILSMEITEKSAGDKPIIYIYGKENGSPKLYNNKTVASVKFDDQNNEDISDDKVIITYTDSTEETISSKTDENNNTIIVEYYSLDNK